MTESRTAPFFSAIARGDVGAVAWYVAQGVDVNQCDADGNTGLRVAALGGRVECLKLLLEAGADPNAGSDLRRDPPLFVAVFHNAEDCVAALLASGANANFTTSDGWTALMHACDKGNPAIVRSLIKAGANVNVVNANGWTALMMAAYGTPRDAVTACVTALIAAGADVDFRGGSHMRTAAHYAIDSRNESALIALIEAGADIGHGSMRGNSMIQAMRNEGFDRALAVWEARHFKSVTQGKRPADDASVGL